MEDENFLENQIENLPFLEELQRESKYKQMDPSWVAFFEKFDGGSTQTIEGSHDIRLMQLIDAYRRHGHLIANINPIALHPPEMPDELKIEEYGFTHEDLEREFPTFGLLSMPYASLKAIIEKLKQRYCQTVSFEFKGCVVHGLELWIQERIETGYFDEPLHLEQKLAIFDYLLKSEILESFLHTKHVGKKRFSLEGSDTLIPMLALMIANAAEDKVEEIVIGMSHRGRLNVLANILNKPIASILKDFDDDYVPAYSEGMGDIRYHKGHANEAVTTYKGKKIKLSVAPNPSHLESVDPVVEGQTHAKQYLAKDETERKRIIPLLMHGDASLSGQGVVYETLQMSKLAGFLTGGTLHIVINNQIGFTTSPEEGRSTHYCTDIAKTFEIPVFHVNAEDPEACIKTILFAYEIRQTFHCDVFIDLNCYRKYGHNEGDESLFTQPLEYHLIHKKKSIRAIYQEELTKGSHLEIKNIEQREETLKGHFQEAYQSLEKRCDTKHLNLETAVQGYKENVFKFDSVNTGVPLSFLQKVSESFYKIPEDFHINTKVKNLFQERAKAISEDKSIDWGTAELLAYGSLVLEGTPVRLAGQDSARGTFSHRHAIWIDQIDNHSYYPLAHLDPKQARFEVLNTCLSEVAALGFEYGYSTISLNGLNLWEAQFGDFINSAQVIIDQYIASGEQKWGQKSNLVLLLPHGFEGQGPEHSSARFERFLALAGHDNMQIVNPSTPAQLFHLLRRQVKSAIKKPLIILTPKGLLRHSACTSKVTELVEGKFSSVLDDPKIPERVRKLIVCSGRIFYDLDSFREKEKINDIAIIRLEQLYPLDIHELKKTILRYGSIDHCFWVQEEPENMGAWPFISLYLSQDETFGIPISFIGRERSSSPATGFYARHKEELNMILEQVFNRPLA